MKKTAILVALFAGLIMTSCKKDRTCECTNTLVSESSTDPDFIPSPPQPPSVSKTKYSKVKKNNVLVTTCVTSEDTQTYSSESYNTNGTITTYEVTRVTKSDCKIK